MVVNGKIYIHFDPTNPTEGEREAVIWALSTACDDLKLNRYPLRGIKDISVGLEIARNKFYDRISAWETNRNRIYANRPELNMWESPDGRTVYKDTLVGTMPVTF